jgi:hypothetical protein
MTWLVNKTRGVILTINGTDYTSNLLQISLSDGSVVSSGVLTTNGSIVLGQLPGGASIEDYDKDFFARGRLVLIDVKNSDDTTVRHPRGYLYIVDSSYSPEERQLTLDVGCRLYLASLSDNIQDLLSQTEFEIPENQQDFSALNNAIQSEAKILWQDNQGNLQKDDFFEGDELGTSRAAGQWVSVLGQTTIEVSPLGQGRLVPDSIELTYTREVGSDEPFDKVDTTETTSNYFLTYPATVWVRRRPEDGLGGVSGAGASSTRPTGRTSDICGDSPSVPPSSGGDETCSEGYTSEPSKVIDAVQSYEITNSYYEGPGGQLSLVESEKYGPAVELNSQYYADLYAFCVWGYGSACNPSGGCPYPGLAQVKQNYSVRKYEYGTGGQLVKTTLDEYLNKLNCAQPQDWRSGVKQAAGQLEFSEFNEVPTDQFFLARRTITTFEYFDNGTIQFERTLTSPCGSSTRPGISSGCIEATCGVETSQRRISRSTSVAPEGPDRIGDGSFKNTVTATISDQRYPDGYVTPPNETTPVIVTQQIPLPLTGTAQQAQSKAGRYLRYIRQIKEGDARGLRISEALRSEILTNWRPGMPFRYADTANSTVLALRMNACNWAMDQDECLVGTDGIYIGRSNGVVSIGSNVTGGEIIVEDETAVNPPLPLSEVIEVNMTLQCLQSTGNANDGYGLVKRPVDQYIDHFFTFVCYVSGGLYAAGSLLAATDNGGVPITNGNVLVTTESVAVDPNLFA